MKPPLPIRVLNSRAVQEQLLNHVSPLEGSGDILFSPVSPSCLSVTKLSALYNLKTLRSISTKLHALVKHIQTMCSAQEPELCFGYFWSYFPLIICNAILCPLYILITVRGISRKLHTFVKHIKTMCHAQELELLHVYFSNYSPLT